MKTCRTELHNIRVQLKGTGAGTGWEWGERCYCTRVNKITFPIHKKEAFLIQCERL